MGLGGRSGVNDYKFPFQSGGRVLSTKNSVDFSDNERRLLSFPNLEKKTKRIAKKDAKRIDIGLDGTKITSCHIL